jgi:NAD(P)-dependent dehydrogenase (short-subunit alcohol dehydrogenase family)
VSPVDEVGLDSARLFENQVVVVTGGGRGIGAAYARMFAARGARVVVNDLDGEAARESAVAVGGVAVPGDASTEAGVEHLIGTARELVGPVDVYCANAGVARAGLVDVPEKAWEVSWQVNVMAHVRASRVLMPGWLRQGHGMFVSTVSAAGLLTIPGAAPYAVTKHAALAYAEWLAVTYGDAGLRVHAVCPQGVRTQMLEDSGPAGKALMEESAIEADDVAAALLTAIRKGQFLVLPHPEVGGMYAGRAADPDRWLKGMRRQSQSLPSQWTPQGSPEPPLVAPNSAV